MFDEHCSSCAAMIRDLFTLAAPVLTVGRLVKCALEKRGMKVNCSKTDYIEIKGNSGSTDTVMVSSST